jgi:hypothetical protein
MSARLLHRFVRLVTTKKGKKMKLSEQLKQDHECGDFGKALEGYADRAELLESAIVAMAEDGWLYHGQEGMSEAQEKCYDAYLTIQPPNAMYTAEPAK